MGATVARISLEGELSRFDKIKRLAQRAKSFVEDNQNVWTVVVNGFLLTYKENGKGAAGRNTIEIATEEHRVYLATRVGTSRETPIGRATTIPQQDWLTIESAYRRTFPRSVIQETIFGEQETVWIEEAKPQKWECDNLDFLFVPAYNHADQQDLFQHIRVHQ